MRQERPLSLYSAIASTLRKSGPVPFNGDHSHTGEGTAHHFTWPEILAMRTLVFLQERGIVLFPTERARSGAFDTTVTAAQNMLDANLIKVKGRGNKKRICY